MGVGGSGPEAVHAQLTSGNVGTIRGLGTDAGDAMTKVRDSIELIRYAQDRPEWDSDLARRTYNMRAWATRASAEVCFNRLNRTKLALEMAADGYVHMEDQADQQIHWYRQEKPKVIDALGMFLLMFSATSNLLVVRDYYTETLAEARDFLDADPFTTKENDWLELGLVKSMLRDLDHGTMPGPLIPETLATGQDDRPWTPQGLGYDPDTGNLVQTSYEEAVDPDGRDGLPRQAQRDRPRHGRGPQHRRARRTGRRHPAQPRGRRRGPRRHRLGRLERQPAEMVPYSMAQLNLTSPTRRSLRAVTRRP